MVRMMIGGIKFEDGFVRENMMGPNSLRILEEISGELDLKKGMRVLDLGCGKGLTSIFLARKFGVTVFATDLWIPATENYGRIKTMGLEDMVIPVHAEAHELPFADDYFDVIISIDAFHYFGHEQNYLKDHLIKHLKEGGRIAIGVPGFQKEFENGIPVEMQPYIEEDYNFHSCDWWKDLWERSGVVDVKECRELSCHKKAWDDWLASDNEYAKQDIAMIEADGGNYLNTISMMAIRKRS